MTHQGKSDHWDWLASTLGAEIPPAAEPVAPETEEQEPGVEQAPPEPEACGAVEPEFGWGLPVEPVQEQLQPPSQSPRLAQDESELSLPRPTYVAPPVVRQRSASDWSRLATDLGIELPEEIELPTVEQAIEPPGIEPPSVEDAQEPPVGEVVDMEESPQLVVTSIEPPVDWQETERQETERQERERSDEPRGRRRRKRRRREPRAGRESVAVEPEMEAELGLPEMEEPVVEETVVEEVEEAEIGFESEADFLALSPEPDEEPVAEMPGEEDEVPTSRPKRRRRRRGRREREPVEAAAEVAEEVFPEAAELDLDADLAEPIDEEEEGMEEVGVGRGDKALHRAIPSWAEAVQIIIAANMESRARHPERRSSHRPRNQNHDRGDR